MPLKTCVFPIFGLFCDLKCLWQFETFPIRLLYGSVCLRVIVPWQGGKLIFLDGNNICIYAFFFCLAYSVGHGWLETFLSANAFQITFSVFRVCCSSRSRSCFSIFQSVTRFRHPFFLKVSRKDINIDKNCWLTYNGT